MTLIRPTRREILRLAAIAPGFALPALARAELGRPAAPNPTHFRFTMGEARLTVISDGFFTQPVPTLAINADRDAVAAELDRYFLSQVENYAHTNHLLVELGDATVLVDVGSGSRFFPTTGRLMANIEAAGIDPAAITHVFITHAHPDHIWGIRDDFDEPILPDAAYLIGETEYAYWMQDDLVNRVPPEAQQFTVGAVNSLSAEGVEWQRVANGHEVVPGVTLIDTPGHTHGHMSLHLESAGERLIALGDAMRNAYVDFERPTWVGSPDMDPEKTVATRLRLLDMAAADGIAVIGYHFPFPGVGHVMREGDGYRFVPAIWMWE